MKTICKKLFKTFTYKTDLRSFQKSALSKEEMSKFLDPYGFLKEDEWKQYQIENLKIQNKEQTKVDEIELKSEKSKEIEVNEWPPEYGFKVKGLEPTRYGDWERKGKCVDF